MVNNINNSTWYNLLQPRQAYDLESSQHRSQGCVINMKKVTRSDFCENPPAYDAVIKDMETEEELPTYSEVVQEQIGRHENVN